MDCSCGSADTVKKEATQLLDVDDSPIRLTYEGFACRRCGRIGCELLFANDIFVYRDTEARKRYQEALESKTFIMPEVKITYPEYLVDGTQLVLF